MKFSNSELTVTAPSGAYSLALPGRRFAAYLIDGVVVCCVGMIPWVGGLVGLAYYLLRDGVGGAGIGKRLVGLHVVDAKTLRPISGCYGTAVKRTLTLYIPLYNILDALYVCDPDRKRQRSGDRWADTLVVRNGRLKKDSDKK